MIFVTVGTQLPFPRLIDAMNDLAPALDEPVIAQTSTATPEELARWTALDVRPFLEPSAFGPLMTAARVVVAHAGMGSILSAQRWQKPLVIMPRRHALQEHRNDHQMATARHFQDRPGIHVAWEAVDLAPFLNRADLPAAVDDDNPALATLVARLRAFIGA